MDFNVGDILIHRKPPKGMYQVTQKYNKYVGLKLLRGGGQPFLLKEQSYIREHFLVDVAETMREMVERKRKDG